MEYATSASWNGMFGRVEGQYTANEKFNDIEIVRGRPTGVLSQ